MANFVNNEICRADWVRRIKFGASCLLGSLLEFPQTKRRVEIKDLYRSVLTHNGRVPLSWVRSTAQVPFSNLGDQLSAIVVAAITQTPAIHIHFDSPCSRIIGIGSIGHQQKAGIVHVWGAGFGNKLRTHSGGLENFSGFPEVIYKVHAIRGPLSGRILSRIGVHSPEIFGDPAWFISRILPLKRKHRFELGVIPHLSELSAPSSQASPKPRIQRYAGGEDDGVKLISSFHSPSWQGFQDKIEEILDCKRIISRSLHGMIIAEAYGIPCAFIANHSSKALHIPINSSETYLDPRFADAYSGFGCTHVLSYGMQKEQPTDWNSVIDALDNFWEPINFSGQDLFDAFPLPKKVNFKDKDWSLPPGVIAALQW